MAYRRGVSSRKTKETPHQQAEAELTRFALSLPETEVGHGLAELHAALKVRGRMFFVFGDPQEMPGKRGDRRATASR